MSKTITTTAYRPF